MRIVLVILFTIPSLMDRYKFCSGRRCSPPLRLRPEASLGLKEAGVEQRHDIAIHDITYISPKGGAVLPTWSSPRAKDPSRR